MLLWLHRHSRLRSWSCHRHALFLAFYTAAPCVPLPSDQQLCHVYPCASASSTRSLPLSPDFPPWFKGEQEQPLPQSRTPAAFAVAMHVCSPTPRIPKSCCPQMLASGDGATQGLHSCTTPTPELKHCTPTSRLSHPPEDEDLPYQSPSIKSEKGDCSSNAQILIQR